MAIVPVPWGYAFSKLDQLGRWLWRRIRALPKERSLKKATTAWTAVDTRSLFASVALYYKQKGVPLFTYPGSSTLVPLYVRPSWG